ncbi:protein LURP-one-related 11-like [Prosopis cineraria]|uniref:protein LURP-one-related 11-like n=1 Tax=Prosopis cineraria TaxID=364024 RepID=UPI00240FE0D4|nr:protein LURP-one-related 11-like [Prosopis cineraria]
MKSLILNGNGCTVFNSQGQIAYRVDNYDIRCAHEVFLMDPKGNVLFTILRKRHKFTRVWEGYRYNNDQKEPNFRVRSSKLGCRVQREGLTTYEVMLGLDKNQPYSHTIESSTGKSSFCKISDQFGGLVAWLKRKKASCGVDLGEDVLSMVVEPNIDLSLIMGLVVAYCLINSKM